MRKEGERAHKPGRRCKCTRGRRLTFGEEGGKSERLVHKKGTRDFGGSDATTTTAARDVAERGKEKGNGITHPTASLSDGKAEEELGL